MMGDRRPQNQPDHSEHPIVEQILKVRRVSQKRAGGSKFHFSVLCVAGDHAGRVGVAIAKAKENSDAIDKAKNKARRKMFSIPLTDAGSIPHDVYMKEGAAIVYMKPAPLGAGIIAGGSIRHILELAGVRNISAKVIGTNNQINNAYAVVKALKSLRAVERKPRAKEE